MSADHYAAADALLTEVAGGPVDIVPELQRVGEPVIRWTVHPASRRAPLLDMLALLVLAAWLTGLLPGAIGLALGMWLG
jgi:hypothetical protein